MSDNTGKDVKKVASKQSVDGWVDGKLTWAESSVGSVLGLAEVDPDGGKGRKCSSQSEGSVLGDLGRGAEGGLFCRSIPNKHNVKSVANVMKQRWCALSKYLINYISASLLLFLKSLLINIALLYIWYIFPIYLLHKPLCQYNKAGSFHLVPSPSSSVVEWLEYLTFSKSDS